MPDTDLATHPIILFDGFCNFCDKSVQWILRRDTAGRFRFAASQSDAGRRLMAEHGIRAVTPDGTPGSMVLIDADGVHLKSSAALRILRGLPGGRTIASLLLAVPRPVRDLGYGMIAAVRYRLAGRRESCVVPEPGWRARFVD